MLRSYTELLKFDTFIGRFNYLALKSSVAEETFGSLRYLNQRFYRSAEWLHVRDEVVARDLGFDLGLEGYPIRGKIYIHHINPISIDDLNSFNKKITDTDNLICCSYNTHLAIHYGTTDLLPKEPVVRTPNDTCPWRII